MVKEEFMLDDLVRRLLEIRVGYNKIGMNRNTWFTMKRNLELGILTYESKRDIALKFGYTIKQPELWENLGSVF